MDSLRPLPLSLLLLLLLPAPSSPGGCHVGTPNECRRAPSVPGLELTGEGFDVVRLAGTGAWAVDTRSWRARDGGCTLCANPAMGGQAQRLPVAAAHWAPDPECRLRVTSAAYASADQLAASQSSAVDASWTAGLDVNPKPDSGAKATVAGEQSKMAAFARSRAARDQYSFSSQAFECRVYRASLGHPPPLHPHFRALSRRLPRRGGPRAEPLYRRFLRIFGTHYVRGVRLGGLYRDVTALRVCQLSSEGQTTEEVKDCLSIEAELKIGAKMESSAKYRNCQEAQSKTEGQHSFHHTYSDRLTEVRGGPPETGADLFFGQGGAEALGAWVSSLAARPGVTHRVLEPLHLLLPAGDPRRELLRRAISRRVLEGQRGGGNCTTRACPAGGAQGDRGGGGCSCRCREDVWVDGHCCPKGKGWGALEVRVGRGRDLWGDYVTATDAYVKVSCGPGLSAATATVANSNHPVWDARLELGEVRLGPGTAVRLEVWDRDHGYDDDLLGACERPLTSGRRAEVCYLTYGSVTFDLRLTCGPHLAGDTCREYRAQAEGG